MNKQPSSARQKELDADAVHTCHRDVLCVQRLPGRVRTAGHGSPTDVALYIAGDLTIMGLSGARIDCCSYGDSEQVGDDYDVGRFASGDHDSDRHSGVNGHFEVNADGHGDEDRPVNADQDCHLPGDGESADDGSRARDNDGGKGRQSHQLHDRTGPQRSCRARIGVHDVHLEPRQRQQHRQRVGVVARGRVVEDVKEADQRLWSGDNSGLDSTMSFLATDFSDLQSDGAPPGSNAPQYLATCKTESNFADLASQEFAAGKDTDAIALQGAAPARQRCAPRDQHRIRQSLLGVVHPSPTERRRWVLRPPVLAQVTPSPWVGKSWSAALLEGNRSQPTERTR